MERWRQAGTSGVEVIGMLKRNSYFDASRQKNIAATPEESVRQEVVAFLKNVVQVPAHLIETEFALCHIDSKVSGRVDILVHDFREGKTVGEPWLLVECKRPGVSAPEALLLQVNRYLKTLSPKYVMLALGESSLFLKRKPDGKGYVRVRELPQYPSNG